MAEMKETDRASTLLTFLSNAINLPKLLSFSCALRGKKALDRLITMHASAVIYPIKSLRFEFTYRVY